MPQRTLDQVIDAYRAAGSVGALPTPAAPPTAHVTPPPAPPYIVPNVYQSVQASSAPVLQNYMDSQKQAVMQYAQSRGLVQPPPPPPPTAGTAYQTAIAGQLGGLATTASGVAGQNVAAFGQQMGGWIGGGVGGVAGGMLGGPMGALSGASTGAFFGDIAGSVLNKIPLVGGALRGMNQMWNGPALEQIAQGNQLRQGTFGALGGLTGGGAGLGGQGLSATGAAQLTQSLGEGGFDRQSMINLTSAAAETGFLDTATNIQQIAKTVKGLAGLMGEMGKLTGDSDFRNNLQELANMRNMGLAPDQAMDTLRMGRMFGRMAGGMQNVQQGGAFGAQMFQAAGLTPGLGMQIGQGAAGVAGAAMGGFTPIQRGLYGGQEGVTRELTGIQAQFLGQTSKMLLPYLAERGEGGNLQINQERLRQVQGGKMSLSDIAGRGAANLGQMGFRGMQDLLMQAPELQTQLGQQLGETGTFTTMGNMVNRLMKDRPEMTMDMAAATVAGGGRQGRMLGQMLRNPEMIERMQTQLTEEQRRVRFEGRQKRLRTGYKDLGLWSGIKDVFRERREISGAAGAAETARERQQEEDEALGIMRADFGGATPTSATGLETARRRFAGREQGGGISELDLGIALPEYEAAGEELRMSDQQLAAADVFYGREGLFSISSESRYSIAQRRGGGRERAIGRLQTEQTRIRRSGQRLRETRKATEKQYRQGMKVLRNRVRDAAGPEAGPKVMAVLQTSAVQFAREMGSKGQGIDGEAMRTRMVEDLVNRGGMSRTAARELVNEDPGVMERFGYKWADKMGGDAAHVALQRTDDAESMAKTAYDMEEVRENVEDYEEELREDLARLGFTADEDVILPGEKAGVAALLEEEDPEVRMAAMIMAAGETGIGAERKEGAAAYIEGLTDKQRRRAEAVHGKLGKKQRQRLARTHAGRDYKKTAEQMQTALEMGKGDKGIFEGLEMHTVLGEVRRQQKTAGLTEVETGEGAGLGTAESRKRVGGLEGQKEMLEDMASRMNSASKKLERAADKINEAGFKDGAIRMPNRA